MRPAARLQAAIELLDAVIAAAEGGGPAADTLIARYFKERRYAGSKDRRAVRELVYRAIRAWPEPPPDGRAAVLGLARLDPDLLALFDGSPHAPEPVGGEEASPLLSEKIAPLWLADRFDPLVSNDEYSSLLTRAPADVRVNRLRASREALILPDAAATPLSPLGLRFPQGYSVEATEAWRDGLIEVQDEGSQLLALACEAAPGELVVDFCAGAGGKTLALAAEMENRGRLVAADTDRARLSRMAPRLQRSGASIVEPRLLNPGRESEALVELAGTADLVLVDAPCSGTGTWRRNPELRWRLNSARLKGHVELQARLLDLALGLLKPGGRLVYSVCSLLAEEGREQALAFGVRSGAVPEDLPIQGGRAAGPGRLLTPGHDGTDGFFVARWRAPC